MYLRESSSQCVHTMHTEIDTTHTGSSPTALSTLTDNSILAERPERALQWGGGTTYTACNKVSEEDIALAFYTVTCTGPVVK